MAPSFDGGDDIAGISGPDEGLRLVVGVFDEAMDRGPEPDDGAELAAPEPAAVSLAKKPSTALTQ